MTVTQEPAVPFGRHLGTAVRGGRALLDDVLVREAMTYETWIILNLLATAGPRSPQQEFERTLVAALQLSDAAIAQLLGQLEAFGLIRAVPGAGQEFPHVEMTDEGEAHFHRVFAAVSQASGQALDGVDPADVQTTIRVLGQFKERVDVMLAR